MRRMIVMMGMVASLALMGCIEVQPLEVEAVEPAESAQARLNRVCFSDASRPRCGDVHDEVSGEEVACGQTCTFGLRCIASRCEAALTITPQQEQPSPTPPLKLPWDVASSTLVGSGAASAAREVIWASAPPDAPLGALPLGEEAPTDPSGGGAIYAYVISAQGELLEQRLAVNAPVQASRVGDGFGHAIVSDERWLVVSAPGIDWNDQEPPTTEARAPIYLYAHEPTLPGHATLNAHVQINAAPGARCGSALALNLGRLLIGCPGGDGVPGSVWLVNLADALVGELVAEQLPIPMPMNTTQLQGLGSQVAINGLHMLARADEGAMLWFERDEPRWLPGSIDGVGFWSSMALGPRAYSGALIYGTNLDAHCNVALNNTLSCMYCYHLAESNSLGQSQCNFSAFPNQLNQMHMLGARGATMLAHQDIILVYSKEDGSALRPNWIVKDEQDGLKWREDAMVRVSWPQLPSLNDRVRFALNNASLVVSVWSASSPQDRRLMVLGRPGLETPLSGMGGL